MDSIRKFLSYFKDFFLIKENDDNIKLQIIQKKSKNKYPI